MKSDFSEQLNQSALMISSTADLGSMVTPGILSSFHEVNANFEQVAQTNNQSLSVVKEMEMRFSNANQGILSLNDATKALEVVSSTLLSGAATLHV